MRLPCVLVGRYLLHDASAVAFTQHLELTYMSDETFLQTALMNAPAAVRGSLVNHNLRYIDWPHGYGDPSAYCTPHVEHEPTTGRYGG